MIIIILITVTIIMTSIIPIIIISIIFECPALDPDLHCPSCDALPCPLLALNQGPEPGSALDMLLQHSEAHPTSAHL